MRPVGSTLTRPRVGEPGRAGRDVTAVERVQHGRHLVGGAGQARHHLGRGESSTRTTSADRRPAPRHQRGSAPVGGLHAGDQPAGQLSIRSTRRPVPAGPAAIAAARRAVAPARRGRQQLLLVQAEGGERGPQPGHRAAAPPQTWRARSTASTRLTRASPVGRLAEDVQAVADLHVLDLAEVAVDVQHEVVERVVVGLLVDVQVVVQLGGLDQRPDLRADRRRLRRVERGTVAYSSSSCSSLARSP